jgi:hypothetical protein
MTLTNVVERLTPQQQEAEPRSLAIVAFFDGWARKALPLKAPVTYPRPLTPDEAESWRDGYRTAIADAAEWERQQHLLRPVCCALCGRSEAAS